MSDGGIEMGMTPPHPGTFVRMEVLDERGLSVAANAAPCARNRPRADEAGDDMTKLKDLKARLMEDPEFWEEYARIDEEYALTEALEKALDRSGYT